jgi:signal transduction histidine kinase
MADEDDALGGGGMPAPATAALASEVAHAVNNPLQVLALLSEGRGGDDRDEEVAGRMRIEVERVRRVTEILGRYGHRGEPNPALGPVGALVRDRLAHAGESGLVEVQGPGESDPACVFDPRQLSQALDDVITVLAAHGRRHPVRLRAEVTAEADQVALTLKASGVRLSRELQAQLLTQVVWSHEDTRVPYPGLAFARAVCEAHGGALAVRGIRGGVQVSLRLPSRAG